MSTKQKVTKWPNFFPFSDKVADFTGLPCLKPCWFTEMAMGCNLAVQFGRICTEYDVVVVQSQL